MAVDPTALQLGRDGDIMRGRLVRGSRIGDVFTEARQHGADAEALQLHRCRQGVVEPLARQEAADGAFDKRQRGDMLLQPGVLGANEESGPDYPHDPHCPLIATRG